ncbi:PAS domain-containing sensor histidine kinase [Daejeonella oryzae]|uniref:PAS domain-containing sensor histidine kinase n=1 Tax=Daejeonella oryzae TaxID=1122943 RepID=UPI000419C18A|nr:PAS domain-containing sensor histidine kinase [Daejeonella oryzae]
MASNSEIDYKQKFAESDTKFQTIFKLTSVACKIISSDLTVIKVNQALIDLLGYSEQEIQGTKIVDYACEEYKAHWNHLQDELWDKNTPFFKLNACLIRKDQSLVWVNVTTILFQEEGITYGYSVLDDITGQKHFEESEKRLEMALQYSKMAAWELDLNDFSVIRSENTHDKIFGYKAPLEEWNLDTYLHHLIPEDALLFKEAINSLTDHTNFDFKGRIHTDNMSFKYIHFQGEKELDEHGNPCKIIGTIKDISKEKLLERQKEDFISIASHELKTPITSLNASLQLINKNISDGAQNLKHLITMANKSMNKVSALVEDLLSASSMNEGQLKLHKSTFILSQLIEDCCDRIRVSGNYSIITGGDLGLKIEADPERVEQVVSNLINNAIKYAPQSKEIRIDIEKQEQMAKISVTDQGPGIAAEKIPLLFDRFYRVESNGSRYSGLGLGLYISSQIIKEHGGQIGADSEEGKGSRFWFTLPMKE